MASLVSSNNPTNTDRTNTFRQPAAVDDDAVCYMRAICCVLDSSRRPVATCVLKSTIVRVPGRLRRLGADFVPAFEFCTATLSLRLVAMTVVPAKQYLR